MFAWKKVGSTKRGWRGLAIMIGGLTLLAGAGYWIRSALLPRADAQTLAVNQTAAPPARGAAPKEGYSDYSRRVVAYIYGTEPVTREQLGEYLIDRRADKLELLIHKRIIDDACRIYNVSVSAAEVESALAEELQGLAIDQNTFKNTLLARYHKNLYEWKEDVIRSRLQMAKLSRSRVRISEDELRRTFEALYGEKVDCQIILWPNDKDGKGKADALADYSRLRDSEEAFNQKAKAQPKAALAATAGRVRPFGRHVMGDDKFDRIVFSLKPNEVSEVFQTIDGYVLVKCLHHYPADTSVRLESVREKLLKELTDKKVVKEMQSAFDTLKKQAAPNTVLKQRKKAEEPDGVANEGPRARQAVAFYNGQTPITREEFGEFLIARYGAEQIEYLINRLIIEKECKAHNITITPQEIEARLNEDLKKVGLTDLKLFQKDYLSPYNKNLYEWREDVIRPGLLMAKLCRDRVQVNEDELRVAFEAEYGEKLEGRMILWPVEQTKYALTEYTQLRDNPKTFEEKAQHQASGTLASRKGKIGPFGKRTLGNKELEEEAFKLRVGEITTLIGTPEGNAVFKLEKRIPADTTSTLDTVRPKLTKQVFERKVQLETQNAFRALRQNARVKVLLQDSNKPVDLIETTRNLLPRADGKTPAEPK